MNQHKPKQSGRTRKTLVILALTILASFGSFAVAVYGAMYATIGVLVSAISFGLMPFAGQQISEKMNETSRQGDLMIAGGILVGVSFLVLFFVLRRRLK